MKNILWIATLLVLTAGAAQADMISFTPEEATQTNEFVQRYALDSFKVASDSALFRGPGEIIGGSVEINEGSQTIRINLLTRTPCPAGSACPAVMPRPVTITLPIRHIAPRVCGGITILAEQSLPSINGSLIRLELTDDNGSFSSCGNADDTTFVKRVKVQLSEENSERKETLSVFSGLPVNR